MSGNLEAVLGPAALRFLRPMRVVGGGGGSYLGLSFCRRGLRAVHEVQRMEESLPSYPCHRVHLPLGHRPY